MIEERREQRDLNKPEQSRIRVQCYGGGQREMKCNGGSCCNKALKINLEHQQFVHSKAEQTSNLTGKNKKITGERWEKGRNRKEGDWRLFLKRAVGTTVPSSWSAGPSREAVSPSHPDCRLLHCLIPSKKGSIKNYTSTRSHYSNVIVWKLCLHRPIRSA